MGGVETEEKSRHKACDRDRSPSINLIMLNGILGIKPEFAR